MPTRLFCLAVLLALTSGCATRAEWNTVKTVEAQRAPDVADCAALTEHYDDMPTYRKYIYRRCILAKGYTEVERKGILRYGILRYL